MGVKQVIGSLTANDSTALREAGTFYVDPVTGYAYRYILVEDAALANGDVCEYSDTTGYEVTKCAGTSSIGNMVAGVAVGTITDAYYGWIMVSGRHSAIRTDGGVSAGHILTPHASYTGRAESVLASGSTSDEVFGFALETDSSSSTTLSNCAGIVRCM